VLRMFRRRIDVLCRAAEDLRPERGALASQDLCITTQSADRLSAVPDRSVDYIFTDPPFGGNLLYSELNFLWESWLGRRTDSRREAVISRSQEKEVDEYGTLMAGAFAEMNRVLKPDAWMTLVFHNTRADVWAAIQQGLDRAGFTVDSAQCLDKSHETFKQVTAEGAVGYDLVVNSRKRAARKPPPQRRPVDVLTDILGDAPPCTCKERTARHLHARLNAEMMRGGTAIDLDFDQVRQLLREHFEHRDGCWWATRKQTR
jgi:hypothetical protein